MKRIMVMGGGVNQIPLLTAANELGYYIVLCDASSNAVGRTICDEFIEIDIADASLVIEICRKKNIDGVVCNTESLMEVLAKVQTELGYMGNSEDAVRNVNDKYLFRKIQKEAKVFAPEIKRFSSFEKAKKYIKNHKQKMILKPEMSSGSRGVQVINGITELTQSIFDNGVLYSRNNYVLIEDYINFSPNKALEAEVFLINGKIELMCLFRTIRDKKNNILPQCYCSDNEIDEETEIKIKDVLQNIFDKAGIVWGEYNVELSFNENNDIFVIEINARQGGMMLPDFVNIYTHIDINKVLVSTAVCDLNYFKSVKENMQNWNINCIHFRVLIDQEGVYQGYEISEKIKKYVVKRYDYICPGTYVCPLNNNYVSVALIDFVFEDKKIRKKMEEDIFNMIKINVN